MARCAHILNNGHRCKRKAEKGSDYCWQHQQHVVTATNPSISHKLYFSLLPFDLLTPLLLHFNSEELLTILSELESIPDFSHLLSSTHFWKQIWKRDISSYRALPSNPYKIYKEIFSKLSKFRYNSDKIMYLTENGYDILLLPMISTVHDYNDVMESAAKTGQIELVNLMLKKGARSYHWAMVYAARHGHISIVKLMLEKGADSYNQVMVEAAAAGHIDIVELMLQNGATDYNGAMINAAYGGHTNIVKLMLEKGADDYNGSMVNASDGGHIEIVKLMLQEGATNYNPAMINAAHGGHIEIVKLMLEKGANDYWRALSLAKTKEIKNLIKSYQNI